jgi:hypothetical protein
MGARHATHYDAWSDEDNAMLKANYSIISLLEIGKRCHPPRNASVVQKRADRIGLPRYDPNARNKPVPEKTYEEKRAKWFAGLTPEEQQEELEWRAYTKWEPPPLIIPPPEFIGPTRTCQMPLWPDKARVPIPATFCGKPTNGRSWCPACTKIIYDKKKSSDGPLNYSSIPSHI